jgi:hypothetical protein
MNFNKQQSNKMKFNIRIATVDTEYLLTVTNNVTIEKILASLSKVMNKSLGDYKLTLIGLSIPPKYTVGSLGMRDGDFLDLIAPLSGGGGPCFTFAAMENGDTVKLTKKAPDWRSDCTGLN